MRKILVSYVTTLPLKGNAPSVIVNEDVTNNYFVEFIDKKTGEIINKQSFISNTYVYGYRQWFTQWIVKVYDNENTLIHIDFLDLTDKPVFIKIDATALGDNLAWVPYVEEFRKHHNCRMICSTFFNDLFKDIYPNILFVKPNTKIENIYAQYYIGANSTNNLIYSPSNSTKIPLQKVASDILGLEYKEVIPNLINDFLPIKRNVEGKYVCISEHGSHSKKEWKAGEDGWQKIVDFLNDNDYKVLVISKEPTNLKNVINLTGDISLKERINDLHHADLYIGVSSGLSWLAWSVGTPVMMISDCTPKWHEFQTKMTRIGKNDLDCVDYEVTEYTDIETVISELEKINVLLFD